MARRKGTDTTPPHSEHGMRAITPGSRAGWAVDKTHPLKNLNEDCLTKGKPQSLTKYSKPRKARP
jgi:hypothetical protein